MACGCKKSLAPIGATENAKSRDPSFEPKTHIYGVGTVILGASLPVALYFLSDKSRLSDTDRYVLKGLAVASGLIIAPLGLMYLRGLSK